MLISYPILNVSAGEKGNKPKQLLEDVFSPDSRDVIYEDDTLLTRSGLTKEIADSLSGEILHFFQYKQFNGSQWLLMFTPKDIYYFNTSDSTAKFITPKYDTGTVDVNNGVANSWDKNTVYSIGNFVLPKAVYYFNSYDATYVNPYGTGNWTNPANMVDGSLSTYADSSTDNQVEYLDGNTCLGTDLGTITKVEIRCSFLSSAAGTRIYLRPVFSGGDGDVHDTNADVVAGTQVWSSWFDITNDTNAPSTWTWTDIVNLDCKVQSIVSIPQYVYCYKVEVRVTYSNNYIYRCKVAGTSGTTQPTWPTTIEATVDDDAGATTWLASTAYALDDLVLPTVANGYYYKCTTAGTSGTTEPTWPTTEGATVTDGTVVWTCYKIVTWECLNSLKVRGTSTVWSTNVKAGDYIRLGGLNDAGAIWYEIASVDSDTLLTLTSAYQETTQSGQAYTIRKVFTTDSDNVWRAVNFTDASLGDIVCMTNWNDYPVYWDGTGEVQTITNANKCKDFIVLAQRLVALHTFEGGASQSQRYRWSATGDITTWNAIDYTDITQTGGKIIGGSLYREGNYAIIVKDDSKFLLYWVGGDFVFDHNLIDNIGGVAINSIVNIPDKGLLYYGSDYRIRLYVGGDDIDISDEIRGFVENISPNNWIKIYFKYFAHKKQVRCLIPKGSISVNNYCLVLRTDKMRWYPWEYKKANSMRSLGEFWNISVYYVDESPWASRYVDEYSGYWDDREFLDSSPVIVMGGDDGYVRKTDSGTDDDGETYTPYFVSKRLDFGSPQYNKRLYKVQPWFYTQANKTVNVLCAIDDKPDYVLNKTIDISDTSKEVEKTKSVVFNANSDAFDIKFTATPPWRLIGFICYYKRTKRVI